VSFNVAEIVGLALLAMLCFGLLRANAALTRRVDALELAAERARRRQASRPQPDPSEENTMDPSPRNGEVAETSAEDEDEDEANLVSLDGTTPDGQPLSIDLDGDEPQLVAFLSTSCGICTSLWERLQSGALEEQSAQLRSVVVTKSPSLEDTERVRELTAVGNVPTVMSTQAWEDYEIPGSPYFLLVGGEPRDVIGEGPANGWGDVSAMVGRILTST
jgi:hypothetical protein